MIFGVRDSNGTVSGHRVRSLVNPANQFGSTLPIRVWLPISLTSLNVRLGKIAEAKRAVVNVAEVPSPAGRRCLLSGSQLEIFYSRSRLELGHEPRVAICE